MTDVAHEKGRTGSSTFGRLPLPVLPALTTSKTVPVQYFEIQDLSRYWTLKAGTSSNESFDGRAHRQLNAAANPLPLMLLVLTHLWFTKKPPAVMHGGCEITGA